MKIEQIRNATLKIVYGGITFLLDPWLQDKGTGFSAPTVNKEMEGVKSPLNELPSSPKEILKNVDYLLVTHIHPDHFSPDYLPKDAKIILPSNHKIDRLDKDGFKDITVIDETGKMKIMEVEITKTPAVHGDSEEVALAMGDVSGYYLTGEKETLYFAGDTVFTKDIEQFLIKHKPDVIILNCAEATTPDGRLIMNLDDIEKVCKLCPDSKVILTHLDSVNHALLTSEDVRQFVQKNGLKNTIVPQNGEWMEF